MMNWKIHITTGALLALLFLTGMPALAQDTDYIIDVLAEKIELTGEQQQAIGQIQLADLEDDAALWYAAARIQQILTDEQRRELVSEGRRGQATVRQSAGFRPRGQRHVRRGWRGQGTLNDEQREELREHMHELSEEHQALRQQLRDEEIDHETYREEVREMISQLRAELSDSLTAAQQALIERHLQRMEQHRTSRGDRRPMRPAAMRGDMHHQHEVVTIYRLLHESSVYNAVQS